MSAGGESARVIFFALAANLGIAVAKFLAAFFSGSASMLAEAIHSMVDSSNQVLLLIGHKKAQKAPSEQHPLGYGREIFFWSFIVAILLFFLGGLFSIYEGIHKLHASEPVSAPQIGIGVLLISMILEGFSFYACIQEVRRQNPYGSIWQWLRKTTSSEILVVFTEDAAAMLGLMIATACLLLSWITQNSLWDAAGAISVGLLLVVVAAFLAVEIKSLLVGEAPATDFRTFLDEKVREHIPGGKVLRLIALQVGGNEVMLSYKIHPGSICDVKQLVDAINRVEIEMKSKFPEIRWQFSEPDFQS